MKTLGDTELIPRERFPFVSKSNASSLLCAGYNECRNEISALPLKQIIEKAFDLVLVRIKLCDKCDNIRGDISICNTCRSRGFTITEGGQK